MLFNSFEFLALLLVTFIIYYSIGRRKQILVLIISSFLFYSAHQPSLVLLLCFSVALNAAIAYRIQISSLADARKLVTTGIVTNLSLLCIFKYGPLIARTVFGPFSALTQFVIQVPLPIGISFFTFEGISLLVDTWVKKKQSPPSTLHETPIAQLSKVSLFISFFPHLIAGPILKAHDFIPQIHSGKRLSDIDWNYSFRYLTSGYFLKMVVADNLKDQTFWIAYPYFLRRSSADLIFMLFGYSMQIFSDFAGYSLIALGLANLFGYKLVENFNYPYVSESFSEFWRRWHISLSSFLKEYLYLPLGGNRVSSTRTYINLFVVMVLGGLWHGAAWSYALWGALHGLALAIERWFAQNTRIRLWRPVRLLGVFLYVTLAWLLFKLTDLTQAIIYVRAIFLNIETSTVDWNLIALISIYSSFPLLYHAHYLLQRRFPSSGHTLRPFAYGVMLFLIVTNSGSGADFIYFQF